MAPTQFNYLEVHSSWTPEIRKLYQSAGYDLNKLIRRHKIQPVGAATAILYIVHKLAVPTKGHYEAISIIIEILIKSDRYKISYA